MKNKTVYNIFPSLLKTRIWGIVIFPFSLLYGMVISVKNLLYNKKLILPVKVSTKVISVGNITVGGTGKTPLVKTLASMLTKYNYRIAVISRGYGGREKGITCVSDGTNILSEIKTSGDEPLLLAENLPGIPVVAGKHRIKAAQYAINNFNSEIIILDDGFQHRKIHRDIDIVTINAANPWGNRMLLPGGPLRERLKNLTRADVFVITNADKSEKIGKIKSLIKKYSPHPVFLTQHNPVSFFTAENKKIELPDFKNQSIIAFSGIANPVLFRTSLINIGCVIKKFIPFPDHHFYTDADLKQLQTIALHNKVRAIITTEKDMVRINKWDNQEMPLYYLKIELTFISELNKFKQIITNKLNQP
ncbi:MAG: tetraacyldisaccharide 4'-kinase [bacterium]